MSFIKRIKTKPDIEILKYEKSIIIGGRTIYNGFPFTDQHIGIIRDAINFAFIEGKKAKLSEIKKVLNIKE